MGSEPGCGRSLLVHLLVSRSLSFFSFRLLSQGGEIKETPVPPFIPMGIGDQLPLMLSPRAVPTVTWPPPSFKAPQPLSARVTDTLPSSSTHPPISMPLSTHVMEQMEPCASLQAS